MGVWLILFLIQCLEAECHVYSLAKNFGAASFASMSDELLWVAFERSWWQCFGLRLSGGSTGRRNRLYHPRCFF